MGISDFIITLLLASVLLSLGKLFFRRLDRIILIRKKNLFYVGLIFLALCAYLCLVTPLFRPELSLVLSIILIISSTLVGLFLYDLVRIYRCPSFSFRKYFSPLPETPAKVSAIIPNYNYANYINQRIDSIVNQKYPVSELIILDDCSTDDSTKVITARLEELAKTHPEIKTRFIPNEVNSGNVFNQWAKAFKYATGDYIWICEADDLCSKYFLKQVMPAFEKDPAVILSYAESDMINERGRRLMSDHRKWIDYDNSGHWKRSYINNGKSEVRNYLAINNTITNVSGVVFRNQKSIPFQRYLSSAKSYHLAGDWYFYAKVLLHGKIAYCAESLNHYRSHSGSVSKVTDNFTHYKEIVSIQDAIAKMTKLPPHSAHLVKHRREALQRQWHISSDLVYYDGISLESLCKKRGIKNETLLSVIIPIYNVAEYLPRCIDSVLVDFPKNSEIILVNDGSTDDSPKICKEYAEKYPCIKVINQKNGGLSAARNSGLKIAKGRFLAFLDSDDFIGRYAYPTMLKKLLSEDSDLIHCDVALYYADDDITISKMENPHHRANQKLLRLMDVPLAPTCANKIFKRELFKDIWFPVGKNNEDDAVVPYVVASCEKISYVPIPFYNYFQRPGSIQNKEFGLDRFVIFDTVRLCIEQIKDQHKAEIISGTLVSHQILALLMWVIIEEKNPARDEYIKLFCEKFPELPVARSNRYMKDYLKLHRVPKLLDLISAETPNLARIRKYIRRGRTVESNPILRRLPLRRK